MTPLLILMALLAGAGVWIDVPYAAQPKDGCGSAVAWMVAEYWSETTGRPAAVDSLETIHSELYSEEFGGVTTTALEGFFQARDFHAFGVVGNWADIEEHLAGGRPLIAVLEPGASAPLHYVVIVGVDTQEHVILLNDPANRKLTKMDRADFEGQWERTNRWLLLAVPR